MQHRFWAVKARVAAATHKVEYVGFGCTSSNGCSKSVGRGWSYPHPSVPHPRFICVYLHISQAMAIAAVPGLPVLPCIAVNTPKQQQQQPHHDLGNSTALGSRGSAFLRSLGVPSSTQQQQMLQHSHSSSHTTRATASLRSASASASAYPAAGCGGTSGLHPHYSYSSGDSLAGPSLLRCTAAADDSSDLLEDAEGSGWMLLGGSSPRVAAAATAAAAAATAAAGSNGNSRADGGSCGSPMAAAAAAAGCNVKLLCDNLRDNYGLPALTASMRELALAVQRDPPPATAASADTAACSTSSLSTTAAAEAAAGAGDDGIWVPDRQVSDGQALQLQQSAGDDSSRCRPLPQQCLQLAGCALVAAEQLVGDLAQQTASVTALQCQLDRSMGRLQQQVRTVGRQGACKVCAY